MASGHVNRINRPNTWLLRLDVRRAESPCQRGAVHTCERLRMPAMTTARHTPTAGVRKRPREEIAGRGR